MLNESLTLEMFLSIPEIFTDCLKNSAGFLGSMNEVVDRTRIFFSKDASATAV
jgi:hypothetical protein